MIHFTLFYHLVSRSRFDPQTISFCGLGSWKKIYFGHWSKKRYFFNHPGSFHCKAFVLLYKFETSWTLLGGLRRGFFFAISLCFSWTFSRLTLLTVGRATSSGFSFFTYSLKTIWAALFRTFGLPPRLLPPNIRIFPFFSNFSDKPVARSLHAYALTYLTDFRLRGFIFHYIHKKQGRSLSNSGYKIQKIYRGKIYSRTGTFGAKVCRSNIGVKRLHNKYETLN